MIAEAAEGRLVCRFAGIGKLVLWVALLGRLVLQAIAPAALPDLPPVAKVLGQALGLGGLAGRLALAVPAAPAGAEAHWWVGWLVGLRTQAGGWRQ